MCGTRVLLQLVLPSRLSPAPLVSPGGAEGRALHPHLLRKRKPDLKTEFTPNSLSKWSVWDCTRLFSDSVLQTGLKMRCRGPVREILRDLQSLQNAADGVAFRAGQKTRFLMWMSLSVKQLCVQCTWG